MIFISFVSGLQPASNMATSFGLRISTTNGCQNERIWQANLAKYAAYNYTNVSFLRVDYLRIDLSPEQASRMWFFLNKVFYREGLLAPRPNPKLEDHPSSAVRDCLFNLFAANLLIGGHSFIRNLRTRHYIYIYIYIIDRHNIYVLLHTTLKPSIIIDIHIF